MDSRRSDDLRAADARVDPRGVFLSPGLPGRTGGVLPRGTGGCPRPLFLARELDARVSYITKVQDHEMPRFRDAAMAVGNGLRTVLERTFASSPAAEARFTPDWQRSA